MNMMIRILFPWFVAVVLSSQGMEARAHALEETTARIILRDGQVEVRLRVDMTRWLTQLQNSQAWLMGDIAEVMPAALSQAQQRAYLGQQLIGGTRLFLNETPVSLQLSAFPKAAAWQDAHGTEIVLAARHRLTDVAQISVQFPESLRAVHTSVVKPRYRLVAPGSTASISLANVASRQGK